MPEKYERIRDSLLARGKSAKTAKRIAAATYNKHRKKGEAPVTGARLGDELGGGK